MPFPSPELLEQHGRNLLVELFSQWIQNKNKVANNSQEAKTICQEIISMDIVF